MAARPDELKTARAYERLMRGRGLRDVLDRVLLGPASAYLLNTPALTAGDVIRLGPRHRVLDLGAGRGRLAALLQQRYGLIHPPVAVDISTAMVRAAARDLGPQRRVELAVAAASRLPFADESFHLIVAAHLFRHLEDETLFRVLLEALRVLKPQGILLAWEFAPTSSRRLNRLHEWLFGSRYGEPYRPRGFGALAPYAVYAGFKHIDRLRLPLPFLFPPVPRVVVMLQKAARPETIEPEIACAERLRADGGTADDGTTH
jgi:SAM-dependent methyltransferase